MFGYLSPTPTPARTRRDPVLLLAGIARHGSLQVAAAEQGIEPERAAVMVEWLNNLSPLPLVHCNADGSARLSEHGHQALALLGDRSHDFNAFLHTLDSLRVRFEGFQHSYRLKRRWDMRTSARNQFLGRIDEIRTGPINSEVHLDIGAEQPLVATVTQESIARLGLEIGGEAIALIKASWVILSSNDSLRCSARNQFRGLVQSVREGPINTEVGLALASGRTLTAVITHESADDMELNRGQMLTALIKASHVILAVDD